MRDTVYLVRTYTGITFEYFFSTQSKLFSNEKSPKYSPALVEIQVTSCANKLFPCFRVLREQLGSISCTQPPSTRSVLREGVRRAVPYYHGLSFFFLRAFFFFLSRKKEEKREN